MRYFEDYLERNKLRPRTITEIFLQVNRLLQWLESEGLNVKTCKYNDLLGFIKKYREAGYSTHSLNKHIRSIRYYYEYKKEQGEADYNPALSLNIKGDYTKLPSDMLTRKQMEQVYNEYKANTPVQKRNKVILGLYIYQGLMREDVERLEPTDVHLERSTILIRRSVRLRQRMLPLAAPQVLQLQEYLTSVRPELLKLKGQHSDKLFITIGSTQLMKDAIRELLNELQSKYKFLKSFQQLRNSLIYHWVKEKNLREAQYMAGHASIYSTQRYKQVSLDDLQLQLGLFHPLG